MTLIALVGVDGAGKTTVARKIKAVGDRPAKYLYMGTAVQSSNASLVTSRLIQALKTILGRRRRRRAPIGNRASGVVAEERDATPEGYVKRGQITLFLRVFNRLAEEWYRQLVATWYQIRGNVVICDRHFLFEYATWRTKDDPASLRRLEHWHMWLLETFYPQPDLVIMLDGPIEVFQERKKEWTIEKLENHRSAVLKLRDSVTHFYQVDATRPLPEVHKAVEAVIQGFIQQSERRPALKKRRSKTGQTPKIQTPREK